MKKKILAIAMSAAMCAGIFASYASKAAETSVAEESTQGIFKMIAGTSTPDTHPYVLGMKKIGELIKEKTGGAVTLEVYGDLQLGNDCDLIEGLRTGSVQMTCVATAPLSDLTDTFLVFDLPFLFETTDIARSVLDSEVGSEILNSVENQGLVGLSWFENGFRNITNNKQPIEKPEDFKGMKIRTIENQMNMAAFKVMGADPIPMAMSEVFTALQQGIIDGQENPIPIIETNKFDKVQKYVSMTGHIYSPAPVFISKDYFDALPAEYKTAVKEAAIEAAIYEREQIDIQTESGLKAIEERGMEVNFPDKSAFKEATASIYDTYVKEGDGFVSPEIYARVQEVIAKNK